MRPIASALSLIALVALASACDRNDAASGVTPIVDVPVGARDGAAAGARVAFVNVDTLLNNYGYLRAQSDILQQRGADADASLQRRGRAFQQEVQQVQQRAQAGEMTQQQMQDEQTRLASKEQELAAERDRITQELSGESQRLQAELQTALQREVSAIQAAEGYDYVLSYGAGSNVLAVNDAYDLTARVLERLNAGAAVDSAAAGGGE